MPRKQKDIDLRPAERRRRKLVEAQKKGGDTYRVLFALDVAYKRKKEINAALSEPINGADFHRLRGELMGLDLLCSILSQDKTGYRNTT